MDPKVSQSWEEFLNPEVLRFRLIASSIYIGGFEALTDSVVERIRNFFWRGFDESGEKTDPRYESEVLSRNRSTVHASLDWLQEHGAIDERDLDCFGEVKQCRNQLAHRLFAALASDGLPPNFDRCFADMVALLRKIEVWWIANVDIPANPDYDGKEVAEAGITPGPVMGMQLLMDIALGDDKRSKFYFDELRKRTVGG